MKTLSWCFTTFLLLLKMILWAQSAKFQTISYNTVPYHVGVMLDSTSSMAQMANTCISMAISDFYIKFGSYKTKLVFHYRDSHGDPLEALSQAVHLLQKYKVQAIIGPQTSKEAEFLVNLGDKAEVPIISFSATSPLLSHKKTPYFVRVASNDNSQVKHIAALVHKFRWREVVIMYEDSTFGYGMVPNLISAFDEIQARVPYRSVIRLLATDNEIVTELYKLMTMPTRVFVVHMSSSLAYRVLLKLNELGMMSKGYAWIVTDGIMSPFSSINSSLIASMKGVLGFRPYLFRSKKLNDFFSKWKSIVQKGNQNIEIDNLNRYCLWAYDAVWALAISAEKLGIEDSENFTNSSIDVANLMSIPVSQTGSKLLKLLVDIKFDGVSGHVELKDGERKSLAYEVINIVGKNIKGLGYWSSDKWISQKMIMSTNEMDFDYFPSLSPLWPGGFTENPRGWVMSVNGKKLRIGVPWTSGFSELVKVELDPQTRVFHMTGFCIEVFREAVELLPYSLPYELVPFGTVDEDYNHLIYAVYDQKLDGAVGDITITEKRSSYVDFTLSFIEPGSAMVVPTSQTHSMWVFLEPLGVDLWLVIFGCFVITGIIVWATERQVNSKLKGSVCQQIEKIFSHSVSNLVFAPGGNLTGIFSKFVVIVWLFAVFIIASSYTASLSSLLTTRQLLQLPKGGLIGSQSAYVMKTTLHYDLNFKGIGRNSFNLEEEYANALKRGSQNGGVSAIIDEIPYLKLFLTKYPDRYAMVNAIYDTNGFGFVFPKRSPLVPDLSGAIAKLRESGRLEKLERDWFSYHKSFDNEGSSPDNNAFHCYRFRGLFLVMGITLILALLLSHLFSKNVSFDEEIEDKKDAAAKGEGEEEGDVSSTGVENYVSPGDNRPFTLEISGNSSDDNIAEDGEEAICSSFRSPVDDTNLSS